ncbi:DUF3050 domain-containing protein [Endothiovibrio diazotrophicus]
MSRSFNVEAIRDYQQQLDRHPVYGAVGNVDQLRLFMAHHIYSVWDFMSLVKYLQKAIAPADFPWTPGPDAAVAHFINSLVLEEESDEAPAGPDGAPAFASHFELYCGAMREVGADPANVLAFLERVKGEGIRAALQWAEVPAPSRAFSTTTFDFIDSGKPHLVAAALAVGREHVIPGMFRAFLARMGIAERDAPIFHFYLHRHIHLDEDFHGPLSLKLLEILCGGDEAKLREAEEAGAQAIQARIRFWDGVLEALKAT